jgi:tRNA (adenine22-N1)-methyltransferase
VKLKGRLGELAGCYSDEEVIWDVGCDHGQLGLSFLDHPRVKEVHLVDPSLPVINTLKENKQLGAYISNGSLFIENKFGQEIRINSENNKIFIAGMGGREIIEILQAMEPQSDLRFNCYISPHKNILELREYLKNSHFRLRDEFLIKDNGRFYQVIGLDFTTDGPMVSPYGDRLWHSSYAREYRNYLLDIYRSHKESKDQTYYRFLESLTF